MFTDANIEDKEAQPQPPKTSSRTKKPKLIPNVAIHPDAESIEFFPDEFADLQQLVNETQPVAVSFEEGEEGVVENHVDIAPDATDSPFAETEDVTGVVVDDLDHDTVEDVHCVGVDVEVPIENLEEVLDAYDNHEDVPLDFSHSSSAEVSDAEDSPGGYPPSDTDEEVLVVLSDTDSDLLKEIMVLLLTIRMFP